MIGSNFNKFFIKKINQIIEMLMPSCISGESWSRDEDHIALITELVGTLPKKNIMHGQYSKGRLEVCSPRTWQSSCALRPDLKIMATFVSFFESFSDPVGMTPFGHKSELSVQEYELECSVVQETIGLTSVVLRLWYLN